jgi:2-dehydropantoate 2-reductase
MVTALAREPLGTVMKNDEYRNMVRGILEEIFAISRRKNINLPSDIIEKSMNKTYNFPAEAKTSYQRDLESGSRFSEGDLFGGTIIREGKALGIPTLVTEAVYKKIAKLYGK